jgi:hypothetical protein
MQRCGGWVAEVIALIALGQGAIQKQDAGWQGVGEIGAGGIEDAGWIAGGGLALLIHRREATEGDTEGKAQVIGAGLWIKFFCVHRQWSAFWAIDGLLDPFLGMTPWRGA